MSRDRQVNTFGVPAGAPGGVKKKNFDQIAERVQRYGSDTGELDACVPRTVDDKPGQECLPNADLADGWILLVHQDPWPAGQRQGNAVR